MIGIVITNQIIICSAGAFEKSDLTKNGCEKFLERKATAAAGTFEDCSLGKAL